MTATSPPVPSTLMPAATLSCRPPPRPRAPSSTAASPCRASPPPSWQPCASCPRPAPPLPADGCAPPAAAATLRGFTPAASHAVVARGCSAPVSAVPPTSFHPAAPPILPSTRVLAPPLPPAPAAGHRRGHLCLPRHRHPAARARAAGSAAARQLQPHHRRHPADHCAGVRRAGALCCAMLCCAMLRHAVPCCGVDGWRSGAAAEPAGPAAGSADLACVRSSCGSRCRPPSCRCRRRRLKPLPPLLPALQEVSEEELKSALGLLSTWSIGRQDALLVSLFRGSRRRGGCQLELLLPAACNGSPAAHPGCLHQAPLLCRPLLPTPGPPTTHHKPTDTHTHTCATVATRSLPLPAPRAGRRHGGAWRQARAPG